jgi:hypothetical protein
VSPPIEPADRPAVGETGAVQSRSAWRVDLRRIRNVAFQPWFVCAGFAVFAAVTCVTGMPAQRVWAYWATGAYLAGAIGLACAPRAKSWWVSGVTFVVLFAPLLQLAMNWQAQHEIWMVQHAAERLAGGQPLYPTDDGSLSDMNGYFPYLPAMALLGLPALLARGLGLPQVMTDVRWTFVAVYLALATITIRDLRGDRVQAWLWFVASPATALPLATGGDDLPVIGLLLVALTLSRQRRTVAAGAMAGLACAAKLTAWPVGVALGVMTLVRHGRVKARWFWLVSFVVTAVFVVPVLIIEPRGFYLHEFAYPGGLARVVSPAASPFPGHLLANSLPAGHWVALGLLGGCAVGMLGWLAWRPPHNEAAVAWFSAAALTVAMLLLPASRPGYLVYPILLALFAVYVRTEPSGGRPSVEPPAPAYGVRTR